MTILYSLWEKKNETTKQEIEKEMQMPLELLCEIGESYGPTRKLHQALSNLVAATIANLERARNGTTAQTLSFSSPAHALDSRNMQLPMRIDPGLQMEPRQPQAPQAPRTSTTLPVTQGMIETPPTSLSWSDQISGQIPTLPPPESQSYTQSMASRQLASMLEPVRVLHPPHEQFEDSMLWGSSLEWTGGWDDFLNAIAM
jgi:hypothetical protein